MRKLLFVFVAMLVQGCSSAQPEEVAAETAMGFYKLLAEGSPDKFLDGKLAADSLPEGYSEQLEKVYRQYLSEIQEKHGGIKEVSISPNVGRTDTTLNLVYAFLLLSYNDSTQEEITVPMVEHDGQWFMK